jgi:hypothetical protein
MFWEISLWERCPFRSSRTNGVRRVLAAFTFKVTTTLSFCLSCLLHVVKLVQSLMRGASSSTAVMVLFVFFYLEVWPRNRKRCMYVCMHTGCPKRLLPALVVLSGQWSSVDFGVKESSKQWYFTSAKKSSLCDVWDVVHTTYTFGLKNMALFSEKFPQ